MPDCVFVSEKDYGRCLTHRSLYNVNRSKCEAMVGAAILYEVPVLVRSTSEDAARQYVIGRLGDVQPPIEGVEKPRVR